MNDKNPTRTIHTSLYGAHAKEILSAVSGQLSDGMWENSRGYDKYWTNFNVVVEVDGEITFHVNTDYNTRYCDRFLENPFRGMTDEEFKQWYAGKLKAVIMQELRDNGIKKGWNRRNLDFKSCYLNYKLDINVADIYCVYDQLLGRTIDINRFDTTTMSRTIGTKKTESETQAEVARRAKIDEIQAAYNEAKKKLFDDMNLETKKLKDKYTADRDKLYKKFVEQMAEFGI